MSPAAGRRQPTEDTGRVRIPADVDRPDKLLAGLTARQLAILAVAAIALWAGYAATRHLVPPAAYGAVAVPVAAVAALLALGRMEGVPADRWMIAAWRHHRSPRRLVPAPDGVPTVPGFLANAVGSHPPALPAPLRLPLAGIDPRGVVDLGADGLAVICRASAVTFSLRTPTEQEALVVGFARFLSSLAEPVQVLVRAERLDVGPAICALLDAAPGLPHLALERAARDHAAFLADLAASRDLLRRVVLIVLRQPMGQPAGQASPEGDSAGRLLRRAAEAVTALGAAGVSLSVLDGVAAGRVIARSLDPAGPPRPGALAGAAGDEPVTVARHRTRPDPAGIPMQEGAIR
ncbi:MAG: PrgI family protein [Actinomycetota bacterium]|nr:PrgI family protein [Actinomycetota bacterium]